MDKKTKNILIIGGAIIGSALLYLAFRKKKNNKNNEPKSNLVDEMLENFGKPINQFTITNNSSLPQTVTLFDAFNNINSPLGGGGMGVPHDITINPSMSFFNQTLINDPKKVNKIKVNVNSSPYPSVQATQLINKVCKDASGDSASTNYFPMISKDQAQGGITEVKPKNLILDGHCVLNYTVQPNTTVTLIIEYKTYKK